MHSKTSLITLIIIRLNIPTKRETVTWVENQTQLYTAYNNHFLNIMRVTFKVKDWKAYTIQTLSKQNLYINI